MTASGTEAMLKLYLSVWIGKQEVVQVETLEMAETLVPADGADQDPLEVSTQKCNILFVS